jgi:hypothetical protein
MALIEIEAGRNAPQRTLRRMQAALENLWLDAIEGLPGTTADVVITHPARTPHRPIVEVNVGGQLPDQIQADLANTSWEIARTMLRPTAKRWSATFNAPAHIRALANRSWDEDGQAYRWPEN